MRQLIELPEVTMVKIDKNMGIKKEDNKKNFSVRFVTQQKPSNIKGDQI